MQKYIFFILILSFALFTIAAAVSAHSEGSNKAHEVLGLPEPGLLPDSPIYFLKDLGRGFRLFFAFDPVKKAELNAHFADEKLAELAKLSETKPNEADALGDALQNYIEAQKRLAARLESLQGKNRNINVLLDKLAGRVLDHEKLFDELEERFTEEKVKETEKEIGETVKKALKLDGKKFKERLKEKIKEDKDDDLEDLDVLEQLEELDEELEEDLKDVKEELKKADLDSNGKAREEVKEARTQRQLGDDEKEDLESLIRDSQKKIEEAVEEAEKVKKEMDEIKEEAMEQSKKAPEPEPKPVIVAVNIRNFAFEKAEVKIPVGSTAIWTNRDSTEHTVTSDTDKFESGFLRTNTTYQKTFNEKGEFPYHCSPHPFMKGKVVVE